jgi:Domain of unknown function (DUF6484)
MSSLKERKSNKRAAPISSLTEVTCAAGRADPPATRPADVMTGRIVSVSANGAPIVDFPGNPTGRPVEALSTARYDLASTGCAVALMFLNGDPAQPLAIGLVAQGNKEDAGYAHLAEPQDNKPPERLILAATQEIVLQCGHARITLTGGGKALVRGTYLSLRSSGMHRIVGASVQIN